MQEQQNNSLFQAGSLKALIGIVNTIYVPVDAQDNIVCDFGMWGGTQQELEERLGCPYNLKGVTIFIDSKVAPIRIKPLQPGKQLPDIEDMIENRWFLLTFNPLDNNPCPKYLLSFQHSSFVGVSAKQELQNKLNLYKQETQLGKGQFGIVTKVQCQLDGKYYAMKQINICNLIKKYGNAISENEARRRITMETNLQKIVKSPNVIKIKEQIETDDDVYIVMELATQESLQSFIDSKKQPLTQTEFIALALQVAQAVKATHDCGIIHRDLKPENLVFSEDKTLKLIDFGFARQDAEGSTTLGTPLFMAPEVVMKERYTNKADIFSLGCIYYFMLTGVNAFSMAQGHMVFQAIVSEEPKPIPTGRFSDWIIELVKAMLRKEPQERISADGVIETLNKEEIILKQGQDQIASPSDQKHEDQRIKLPGDLQLCKNNKLVKRLQGVVEDFEARKYDQVIENSDIIKQLIAESDEDPDQINDQLLASIQILSIISKVAIDKINLRSDQIEALNQAFINAKWRHMMYFIFTNKIIAKEAFQNSLKQKVYQMKVYQNADKELEIAIQTSKDTAQIKSINSKQQVTSKEINKPIDYEVHPIKNKAEFEQLMLKLQQTQKQLQTFVDDLVKMIPDQNKNMPVDRQINHVIFREICKNIILNHVHWGNDMDAIKSDIQHVFDNYSVKNSTDGTHYGDNTTSKQVQFQKHVAKYQGGKLIINDFTYSDNDVMISPFVSGEKFGITQYYWISGSKCICVCKADKKFGFGQYNWTSGSIYEGDFANDVRMGKGVNKFANGDVYEGDFVDDKICGFGIKKYKNGNIYTGQWKDEQKNGQGKLVKKNGEVLQGIWKDGELVQKQ